MKIGGILVWLKRVVDVAVKLRQAGLLSQKIGPKGPR